MNGHDSLAERGLTQEAVFAGKVLRVRVDTVALPDGRTAQREVVDHPGAVAILAVTDRGEIVLVRQYRYAIGATTLELPAGCLDRKGEDVETAARRELREETGFEARDWQYMTAIHPSPGILGETMHLFLATGLTAQAPEPEDDEFIEVALLPLEAALDAAWTGTVRDAKTLVGLLWYARFGETSAQKAPPPPGPTL